jgi:NADH-quinone oxidoreductase subunit E
VKDKILNEIDLILENIGNERENLIPILKKVQTLIEGNYIPHEVAKHIADKMNIPESEVFETVSFYAIFNDKPKGKFMIRICDSTVCKINDSYSIVESLEEVLNIKTGEVTKDGMFSLDYSPCFGACDISPAIRVNDIVYGNLNHEKIVSIIERIRVGELS